MTLKDLERYMAKQWEIIDGVVMCTSQLRPTLVHDALNEIKACEDIIKRMRIKAPAPRRFDSAEIGGVQ